MVDDNTPPSRSRWLDWIPRLEREDRVGLLERIESGATWDIDFVVMMGFSTALASFGLLLDAGAVVIGAMLVAPLMTPLIGAGLALVQGNLRLFRNSLRAMSYGIMVGFVLSALVGVITPAYDPTLEVQSRSEVNILDLLVALVSGMAAAYAMTRAKLAATMAGVAIAAALVPPLAVVGIALIHGEEGIAGNAFVLLLANVVSIIVGSALVFRLVGIRAERAAGQRPVWARRTLLAVILATILLTIPLSQRFAAQGRLGQARPLNYPASPQARAAARRTLDQWPDVELIMIGRVGVEPEVGIVVLLGCERAIEHDLEDQLRAEIQQAVGADTPVTVIALREAWVPTQAGPAPSSAS